MSNSNNRHNNDEQADKQEDKQVDIKTPVSKVSMLAVFGIAVVVIAGMFVSIKWFADRANRTEDELDKYSITNVLDYTPSDKVVEEDYTTDYKNFSLMLSTDGQLGQAFMSVNIVETELENIKQAEEKVIETVSQYPDTEQVYDSTEVVKLNEQLNLPAYHYSNSFMSTDLFYFYSDDYKTLYNITYSSLVDTYENYKTIFYSELSKIKFNTSNTN